MALTDKLVAIGNAIREKNGTTDLIPLADMPQAIKDISSGGGIEYTSITYNDNTISLIDTDGIEHIIEYEYTDETLTSIKYDGKVINLTYDGDLLVKIGKTIVDFENVESNGSGETEELEALIDESGVLDSTEGTVTEKVEQLIDKIYVEYPLPQDDYVYYRYPPCDEDRYIRINKATIEYGSLNANGYTKIGTIDGTEDGSVGIGGGTKVIYKYIIPAHQQDFIIKLSTLIVYSQSTAECTEVYCGSLNWETAYTKANMYQFSSTTINGIKKININVPITNSQLYKMFEGLPYQTIKLNTVNVTGNAAGMFNNCVLLNDLQYEELIIYNPNDFFRNCVSFETIDCSKIVPSGSINNMFNGCSFLKTLDLSSWASQSSTFTNVSGLFRYCNRLKTINFSGWNLSHITSIGDWFDGNTLLENVILDDTTLFCASFSIAKCTNLSNYSIASIINALPTLTEGTTKTLTLHANHKIIQSQVDSANAKGWTVAGGTVVSEEEYYG